MENLKKEIKNFVVSHLNLEEMSVEDINDDDPLFGDGLGLDSIDALELIVMLEKEYGIKIRDPEKGKAIFQSINSLAEFVHSQAK